MREIKRAQELDPLSLVINDNVAYVYLLKDQAFAWLERDFQQRSGLLSDITWRPTFDGLRSDPRYAGLVRRMGLQP